jgi:hypothetical protein
VSTKDNAGSYAMTSDLSNLVQSYNPYDVLGTVAEVRSEESGPSGSPTSSGGSVSQHGGDSATAIGTPSRESESSGSQGTKQHRVSTR